MLDSFDQNLGVNEGVIAKLRQLLKTDFLVNNTCVVHSFALAGAAAAYHQKKQSESKLFLF